MWTLFCGVWSIFFDGRKVFVERIGLRYIGFSVKDKSDRSGNFIFSIVATGFRVDKY